MIYDLKLEAQVSRCFSFVDLWMSIINYFINCWRGSADKGFFIAAGVLLVRQRGLHSEDGSL